MEAARCGHTTTYEGVFGTTCEQCRELLKWNGVNYMESEKFPDPDDCDHSETVKDLIGKNCVACGKRVSWNGTSFTDLPPRPRVIPDYEWMYRVKDLREILDKLPGDMPVVLSKDGEGNEYKLLVAHNETYRVTEEHRGRHIEIVGKDHAADDDMIEGCDHKDCRYATGEPVLVLWPA